MVGPTEAISCVRTCTGKIKCSKYDTKNKAMDEALKPPEKFPRYLFVLYVSSLRCNARDLRRSWLHSRPFGKTSYIAPMTCHFRLHMVSSGNYKFWQVSNGNHQEYNVSRFHSGRGFLLFCKPFQWNSRTRYFFM